MKKILILFFPIFIILLNTKCSKNIEAYEGSFVSGTGDIEFLKLIDESYAFFSPNPVVPNLTMVYRPDWDTFTEGAGWGAWWIQNSYGFSYSATPFLQEPWFSLLQRSWDLFWENQGDGVRKGLWGSDTTRVLHQLIAPDGCLGDAAAPGQIAYRQGDGDVKSHDWFYEATAAGVVMQAEILLAGRDMKAISKYLLHMERSCDFIERARDTLNNLFLVGPACNLLAPSYGGVKQADGTFGKGYLAGLSITYLAALDRMTELYKMTGNDQKLAEYQRRHKITRESLPKLLTGGGYFVKSIEPGGIKHGVLGQEMFGYLEGVANADAVALRVVDNETASGIYNAIAGYTEIRPFDFLLTNAPGLDDTYISYGSASGDKLRGFWTFGQWVNGGVWGTVEGRAILMYYRLGKFEDVRRSAIRAMKWAKDFRMDAPWSQRGENTDNPWSDSGRHRNGSVAVMIDNFAIPAATIRGLFDYDYKSDMLILRPRIPGTITKYTQKQPIRFGDKELYLSCINGGPKVRSVKVNGKTISLTTPDEVVLMYNELPEVAKIEIVTEGGWPEEQITADYPVIPELFPGKSMKREVPAALPDSLEKPYRILTVMKRSLKKEPGSEYEMAFINTAIKAFEDSRVRKAMDPGPGYYRPLTEERNADIQKFYDMAALTMYQGFVSRMQKYAEEGDDRQKKIAEIFNKAIE